MDTDDSTRPAVDDRLLEDLRAIAGRIDPEPDHVRAGARAAFSWRNVDADLATLTSEPTGDAQDEAD